MALPLLHAGQQQRVAALEKDEADIVTAGAQTIPVGMAQRGAGDDAPQARLPPGIDAGAMASSQGRRSSSSSGTPWLILAILAGGCRSSPSISGQPRCPATNPARVDLPQPETPMKMSAVTGGVAASVSVKGRVRSAVMDPADRA